MQTVLFVGAGRHQRRAILRAKELGLRVAAVDRNAEAPGLQEADVAEVVDFADEAAVIEAAKRMKPDGVLTVSADRAVPVVAAVAEALGLPGIGTETAHLMTHKIAMRTRLAEAGVPQPRYAAVRNIRGAVEAFEHVGVPSVLKPADSGGQRGIFRIDAWDDLEAHLHAALAESRSREAILEEFVEGIEMNGIVIARRGEMHPLTLSDRLRPPGDRLRRRLDPRLSGDDLRRPAGGGGAGGGAHRAGARPPRRDRVPAADRDAGRARSRRRVRGADPRRADGGPRPPRRRHRSDRRAAEAGARRATRTSRTTSRTSRNRSRSASSPPSPARCRPARC